MTDEVSDRDDGSIARAASDDVVNDELVEVFDTEDEAEAMVVKGLLESEGIAALVSSLDAQQSVLPGVGGVTVRVRADQAAEATRVIEESRNSAAAEESAEDDPGEAA